MDMSITPTPQAMDSQTKSHDPANHEKDEIFGLQAIALDAEAQDTGNDAIDDEDNFPEGGREAWLVVLGAFLLLFPSFGFMVSNLTLIYAHVARKSMNSPFSAGVYWHFTRVLALPPACGLYRSRRRLDPVCFRLPGPGLGNMDRTFIRSIRTEIYCADWKLGIRADDFPSSRVSRVLAVSALLWISWRSCRCITYDDFPCCCVPLVQEKTRVSARNCHDR
jgi:hypothetical protein